MDVILFSFNKNILHVKLHPIGHKQRKEQAGESAQRWNWAVTVARWLFLRSPDQILYGCAGNFETSGATAVYYSQISPFTKGHMSDELVYHLFEELEHGPLTSSHLKKNWCWSIVRLLTAPVSALLLLFPPIMTVMHRPSLLFQPTSYIHLVQYYLTFVPIYCLLNFHAFLFWVLPFPEPIRRHQSVYKEMERIVDARGIEYDVVGDASYVLL